MRLLSTGIVLSFILLNWRCSPKNDPLFQRMDHADSGIDFNNQIIENDSFNILRFEHMYNGGAVAIGDFNNDGLSDIFFSGNMVPNRLYINRGDLKFEDVTITAAVGGKGRWSQGTAVVDINSDGWLDLYVCATLMPDSSKRENMMFVNQGLNDKGLPVFKDEAPAYGINDNGFSTNASFLDYDMDGDLDLYVLTDVLDNRIPTNFRPKIKDGSSPNNDRLYRNNGDGTFTNLTKKAGILIPYSILITYKSEMAGIVLHRVTRIAVFKIG